MWCKPDIVNGIMLIKIKAPLLIAKIPTIMLHSSGRCRPAVSSTLRRGVRKITASGLWFRITFLKKILALRSLSSFLVPNPLFLWKRSSWLSKVIWRWSNICSLPRKFEHWLSLKSKTLANAKRISLHLPAAAPALWKVNRLPWVNLVAAAPLKPPRMKSLQQPFRKDEGTRCYICAVNAPDFSRFGRTWMLITLTDLKIFWQGLRNQNHTCFGQEFHFVILWITSPDLLKSWTNPSTEISFETSMKRIFSNYELKHWLQSLSKRKVWAVVQLSSRILYTHSHGCLEIWMIYWSTHH